MRAGSRAGSTEQGSVPAVVLRGGAHYVAGLGRRAGLWAAVALQVKQSACALGRQSWALCQQ